MKNKKIIIIVCSIIVLFGLVFAAIKLTSTGSGNLVKTNKGNVKIVASKVSKIEFEDYSSQKIDGVFIKDLKINNESYYLVEAIIRMAKAFKIKTIAEFVENQEINDILKQMGVDYGQGYYFGKPEVGFNFH